MREMCTHILRSPINISLYTVQCIPTSDFVREMRQAQVYSPTQVTVGYIRIFCVYLRCVYAHLCLSGLYGFMRKEICVSPPYISSL